METLPLLLLLSGHASKGSDSFGKLDSGTREGGTGASEKNDSLVPSNELVLEVFRNLVEEVTQDARAACVSTKVVSLKGLLGNGKKKRSAQVLSVGSKFEAKISGMASKRLIEKLVEPLQVDKVVAGNVTISNVTVRVVGTDPSKRAQRERTKGSKKKQRSAAEASGIQASQEDRFASISFALLTDRIRNGQVRLGKLGLQDTDVKNLIEMVACASEHKSITSLDLSGNCLGNSAADELALALMTSLRNVRRVTLLRNPLVEKSHGQRVAGAAATNALHWLAERGSEECSETDLLRSLHERMLGDIGAICVAKFLASDDPLFTRSYHLPVLGLAKNGIGAAGASAVAKALLSDTAIARSVRLLEIYSNNNSQGQCWAEAFAPVIKLSPSLTSIDLGGNGINDEGCALLVSALASSVLNELHLDYNQITDRGASLLQAVVPCSNLHTLWLHGNPLSQVYAKSPLAAAVFANRERVIPRPDFAAVFSAFVKRVEKAASYVSDLVLLALPQDLSNAYKPPCADKLARCSIDACEKLLPGNLRNASGQIVLSCVIMEPFPGGQLCAISLGLGTRFVDSLLLGGPGDSERVKDSHAEVVARRAFLRFIISQLYLLSSQYREGNDAKADHNSCIFTKAKSGSSNPHDSSGITGQVTLKTGIRFFLYTSTAPCGAASTLALDPSTVHGKGGGKTCTEWAPGARKSCTDKIRRWEREGLQSKPLRSKLSDKLCLSGIVIGRRFSERCQRCLQNVRPTALRVEDSIQKAQKARGDSDSVSAWTLGDEIPITYDGKTGLMVDTLPTPISPWWMRQEVGFLT